MGLLLQLRNFLEFIACALSDLGHPQHATSTMVTIPTLSSQAVLACEFIAEQLTAF